MKLLPKELKIINILIDTLTNLLVNKKYDEFNKIWNLKDIKVGKSKIERKKLTDYLNAQIKLKQVPQAIKDLKDALLIKVHFETTKEINDNINKNVFEKDGHLIVENPIYLYIFKENPKLLVDLKKKFYTKIYQAIKSDVTILKALKLTTKLNAKDTYDKLMSNKIVKDKLYSFTNSKFKGSSGWFAQVSLLIDYYKENKSKFI
jgi:hypothetical protein